MLFKYVFDICRVIWCLFSDRGKLSNLKESEMIVVCNFIFFGRNKCMNYWISKGKERKKDKKKRK